MQSEWLDHTEYPFKSQWWNADGHRMHYIDEGKGETVLFVHGTPSWSFDFRHIISDMKQDFRCIAIDHIGFGLSDKPKEYNYTTLQHSQVLEKFIKEKNLMNITMVVHDFGGPIGLYMALQHPDLIKQMVILNSWLWSVEEEPDYIKMKRILKSPFLPFLYRYLNFSPRFLMPNSFGKMKLPKRILAQYIKPFQRIHEREGPLAFARSLLHDQPWFESLWAQRNILSKKPVLFIWGMRDRMISPKYLQKFISGFPEHEILSFDDAGHFPQEEEPVKVIHAIRKFLNRERLSHTQMKYSDQN